MRIGVVKQREGGETRVALVPETIKKLLGKDGREGLGVVVERGAGDGAFVGDEAFGEAGAAVEDDAWGCDAVLCVRPPTVEQVSRMREGATLIGLLNPVVEAELVRALMERGVTALAFEVVPRITRAQAVDVLSSMSTIAGYRAAVLAAEASPRMLPMFMTAAGTLTAAKAVVLGAGVAGLQAIATLRRLGASVEAYDVRAAAAEQVRSLGAKFIELEASADAETAGGYARAQSEDEQARQREALGERLVGADVIVTTALIPGKPAPRLVDASTVRRMRAGSVVVDLAAPNGGNCEATKPGERAVVDGVSVLGPLNLAAEVPAHASLMFSRNAASLLELMLDGPDLKVDMDDEVVAGMCVTKDGDALHGPTREALGLGAAAGGGG